MVVGPSEDGTAHFGPKHTSQQVRLTAETKLQSALRQTINPVCPEGISNLGSFHHHTMQAPTTPMLRPPLTQLVSVLVTRQHRQRKLMNTLSRRRD